MLRGYELCFHQQNRPRLWLGINNHINAASAASPPPAHADRLRPITLGYLFTSLLDFLRTQWYIFHVITMTSTPPTKINNVPPTTATPRPPPPPQPGEEHPMMCQSTANVPAHGGGPAAQDSMRNKSAPNPDNDDAGFIFLQGATTPLASAAPKSDKPFTVPTSNTWDTYAEAFSDGKDNTTVAPDATTPTKSKEAHCAAEDSLDSILKELRKNEAARQRRLDKCFKIYSSNEQERGQKFEYRQSTFLTDINKRMRALSLQFPGRQPIWSPSPTGSQQSMPP
jgi:hypothetical protein